VGQALFIFFLFIFSHTRSPKAGGQKGRGVGREFLPTPALRHRRSIGGVGNLAAAAALLSLLRTFFFEKSSHIVE